TTSVYCTSAPGQSMAYSPRASVCARRHELSDRRVMMTEASGTTRPLSVVTRPRTVTCRTCASTATTGRQVANRTARMSLLMMPCGEVSRLTRAPAGVLAPTLPAAICPYERDPFVDQHAIPAILVELREIPILFVL